jgi:uncharacterized RDD family membrane protein YckC
MPPLDPHARKTIIDFANVGNFFAQRQLLTPEGLYLWFPVASLADRVTALITDYVIIIAANILLFLLPLWLLGGDENSLDLAYSFSVFTTFVVNNIYFIFFELRWQGRTPGKRANRLWVINRSGGELSAYAVVSRNLTRQVEIWFPLMLLVGLTDPLSWFSLIFPIFWLICVTFFPLWNKDHLRAGDLLGGTIVISLPDEELLPDLTGAEEAKETTHRGFTKEQLSVYGSYELHILEEILRKAEKGLTLKSIALVAGRISARIGSPLPQDMDYASCKLFLTDFYSAERAFLEEAKLYGRHKANQFSPMVTSQAAANPYAKNLGRKGG